MGFSFRGVIGRGSIPTVGRLFTYSTALSLCDNRASIRDFDPAMAIPKDAFRRFQEELAALDRKAEERASEHSPEAKRDRAKADFLALREKHGWSVADVVAFFPEEEGIQYLQALIAAAEVRPVRRTKKSAAP
jgi:hypothetical protein